MGIVKQTIDFRNANQVHRNDFIQLLLELKNQKPQENANDTIELTEELIAAQVSPLLRACEYTGTSRTTMVPEVARASTESRQFE